MWYTHLYIRLVSNEETRNFTIAFTDSQNISRKYSVTFWNKEIGSVGWVVFTQANTNRKWRNLFRYPDYKKSKFEKEYLPANILMLKFFNHGVTDPYEGKRPIPVDKSFKVSLNDDLNRIGVGKVRLIIWNFICTLIINTELDPISQQGCILCLYYNRSIVSFI